MDSRKKTAAKASGPRPPQQTGPASKRAELAKKDAPPVKAEPKRRSRPGTTAAPKARTKAAARRAESELPPEEPVPHGAIRVRRMHRRDLNQVWDFLKVVFRDVNRETVEYQRPKSKQRFVESYDDEGIEQLIFETEGEIVGYAECAFEPTGSDNWINPRYFESRDIRPLFVEELASHPDYQGRGVGSFMLEQLEHLARVRGCTHLVLEVAENNRRALTFYKKRSFSRLDAAVFMAKKVENEPELLPPRPLKELGPQRESQPEIEDPEA
jgi:ribosomal protein S18 acetylase RimI-like enzyme